MSSEIVRFLWKVDGPSRNLIKANFSSEKKGKRCAAFGCSKTFYGPNGGKISHSPILHYAFSSWIKKAMALSLGKQICFTIEWGCAEILPQWFAYEPSLLQVYVRKHVFLLSI